MRHPIKNKKNRIQTWVTFLCRIATCGSDKKKQGSKKKTATSMELAKIMMAHTAKILPAIKRIVDIFFKGSLIILI
jgi:succinate dehydrogenase/fumarate reductase-like Fe-S protein